MNVIVVGQKWFGAEVLRSLAGTQGVSVTAAFSPRGDRVESAALSLGVPAETCGLSPGAVKDGTDLIVAAHSHEFISERVRLMARFGGIGYHPSLLPLHRGRDAVRWAIRMGDKVTGGSVYRLSNRVDGGAILGQRHVFIRRDDDAESLWRRELGPLGVEMLAAVVADFAANGYRHGATQDESIATWEPSIDRAPIFRPDLVMLPPPTRRATGAFGGR